MNKNIAIIGGDLRIVKLAEMLAKDNFKIKTYGLEKATTLNEMSNIKCCDSIQEALDEIDIIIGPIPLSSNNIEINAPFSKQIITLEELAINLKQKIFIAGSIKKEFYQYIDKNNTEVIDILEREELVVLNTIATAEGAIQIVMEETIKTIYNSNILILGFGRVGKTLANKLKALEANVYCEARKNEDLAWIKTYGYEPVNINDLNENLNKFDIIINTIPNLILGKEEMSRIKKECLLIDLASKPGGIDSKEANKQGIKMIWALALPGKVAPLTSAEFIKDTLYNILREIENRKREKI